MIFVVVHGVSEWTSDEVEQTWRSEIVASVSTTTMPLGVRTLDVIPIFLSNTLPPPLGQSSGGSTIYVRVDTALFSRKTSVEYATIAKRMVEDLKLVVAAFFDGEREVAVGICELNPDWRSRYIPPSKTEEE